MNIKLTICLVTYNGEKYLEACIKSVFNQSFKDWEFLIMDNASNDRSVKIVDELIKDELRVTILAKQDKNIGFAGGYNVTIKKAIGEYILLLNQDIILEPDYLEKIVNFLDNNKNTGAVIGKILRLTMALKPVILTQSD